MANVRLCPAHRSPSSRASLFCFCFFYFLSLRSVQKKPPVVYKHFMCLKITRNKKGIYNGNVAIQEKDVLRTKFIFHFKDKCQKNYKIEDLCYFQNSGIDQCLCLYFFFFCFEFLLVLTDYLNLRCYVSFIFHL